jgi:hypothetical protein
LSSETVMGAGIITDLLGGAERVRPRARGFADWSPRAETLALLARVNAVLGEYADHLPLTLRQIFYRLVGAHGYEKTEQAYERLGEHLVRARRARLIQMDAIRDDGGTVMRPTMWESAEEYLAAVRARAGRLMLDRTAGQKTRLTVVCEAAGMVPQLARVTNRYGITVMSYRALALDLWRGRAHHRPQAHRRLDRPPTDALRDLDQRAAAH